MNNILCYKPLIMETKLQLAQSNSGAWRTRTHLNILQISGGNRLRVTLESRDYHRKIPLCISKAYTVLLSRYDVSFRGPRNEYLTYGPSGVEVWLLSISMATRQSIRLTGNIKLVYRLYLLEDLSDLKSLRKPFYLGRSFPLIDVIVSSRN